MIQLNNVFSDFEDNLNSKINTVGELSIVIILLEKTLKGYINKLNVSGFDIDNKEHKKLLEIFNSIEIINKIKNLL